MNEQTTWKIEYFTEIDSTNEYAKTKRADRQNRIAVAESQSGGKGTKGRSFSSGKGGVYLSMLTFYKEFPAKNAFQIMASTAVAVAKTLEVFGLKPVIKWANDIFVHGKKICGILIENTFSGAYVDNAVIGVGLNVSNELPAELNDIAITMEQALKKRVDVNTVRDTLIAELKKTNGMDEYINRIGYMGKKATLICNDKTQVVTLRSVDSEGGLNVVTSQGETLRFVAGEISLKLEEKE